MNNKQPISKDVIQTIIADDSVRRQVARDSHYWFFHMYFAHYVQFPTDEFQKEIFSITEDTTNPLSVIVAFRGSGKSSIVTTSYPIWSILGKQQKKFVVILSQTQRQARQHLSNLKCELETNELLKKDLGPFQEQSDEWGMSTLVIPKYNARIVSASTEQSIRGSRHGQHRPDLIICDDVEDLQSTKTREGREKTYQWFNSEIVPLGGDNTKIVMVGNLLHGDSLLMKLKDRIENGKLTGIYREYPLVSEKGTILWKSRYKDEKGIELERKKVASEEAWQREYLLKIITTVEQVVHPDWIHYYHERNERRKLSKAYIGIDLAVSQKDSADYTAIIMARAYDMGKDVKVYIDPLITNKRLTFPECVDHIRTLATSFEPTADRSILVETNGYQQAMVQQLSKYAYQVKGISNTTDKRTRLATCTEFLKTGKIVFPQEGAEQLIEQILGFGKEKHDDLVDAFTLIVNEAMRLHAIRSVGANNPTRLRIRKRVYPRGGLF